MGSILLLAVAILAVIIVAGHFYSGWWINRLVSGRHKYIQEIYETGRVPKDWANPEREMLSLMNYVKNSRLMVDEETRAEVYKRLEEAQAAWLAGHEES